MSKIIDLSDTKIVVWKPTDDYRINPLTGIGQQRRFVNRLSESTWKNTYC